MIYDLLPKISFIVYNSLERQMMILYYQMIILLPIVNIKVVIN